MSDMQAFRQLRSLTRFVLVWFALFIGVATSAPLVGGDGLQMVCTGTGVMKLIDSSDDGKTIDLNGGAGRAAGTKAAAGMDCPLCASVAPVSLPTPVTFAPVAAANLFVYRAQLVPPSLQSAPALPSRGPPHIS
jgi:Protein of unknown function (DUF2946)